MQSNLIIWITFPFLQSRKTNFKMSQFSRFLPRRRYAILIKILKMTQTFYFVPFIKKTHLNHVENPIWSFWITFTFLQSNFKMSQFSRFLLWHGYGILVKIWKWPKLLNFVPFIKKRHVNHFYNRIWSFWITFTFLQSRKTIFKRSQFLWCLLSHGYVILVKIWKW